MTEPSAPAARPAPAAPATPAPGEPGPATLAPAESAPAESGPAESGPAESGPATPAPAEFGPAAAASAEPGPGPGEPQPAFADSALGQAFDTGFRVLAGAFVTVLAIVLALVEAFYAPLRTFGVAVPVVSLVLAVVGNASLVWFARFATGSRLGVVAPCVAWLGTMLALSSRTAEGDLILPGDWRGLGLFFLGASTLTVAGFLVVMPTVNPPRAVAGKP